MVGFAQIVRVHCSSSRYREVIIFNNSNFTAVKKTASMRMGGVNPLPHLATPLQSCPLTDGRVRSVPEQWIPELRKDNGQTNFNGRQQLH